MATNMVQPTASQQASAALHLERQSEWRYIRLMGTRYVVLPSGRSNSTYWVRADARGCSCKHYATTLRDCSHMIAVRRSNERPAVREVRGRYEDLFPPCQTDGCHEIAETHDGLCDRCASELEWRQAMDARVASRGRG